MKKRLLSLIMLASFCVAHAFASGVYDDAGTCSMQFLKLGVGARPLALGGSYCAVSDDTFGIFWNPAGASRIQTSEYGLMYNMWLSNISQEVATASFPLASNDTLSLGILYVHMPELAGSDIFGNSTGSFNAYDILGMVSYSSKLSLPGFHWGVNAKFFEEGIEKERANGYSADLGILYQPVGSKLSLGMAVQNLGPATTFVKSSYSLPRNIKAGAAYRFMEGKLLSLADINKPVDEQLSFGLGLEYKYLARYSLRAGWQSKGSITAGLGAQIKSLYFFDYAFAPYDSLGTTHLLTMRVKFDNVRRARPKNTVEAASHLLGATTSFVYGMVINENGAPVNEAVVKVSKQGDELLRLYTEYDGSYQTPELPSGRYEIKAWKFRYEADAIMVKIAASEPIEADFTIVSEKLDNFVYGKVTDAKGTPVQRAVIELVQNGKEVAHSVTNIDGKFMISELPFGIYEIKSWTETGSMAKPKKCRIAKGKPTYIELILK